MKSKIKNSNIVFLVFSALFILIGVFRLMYLFSLRDGHHVDETWSYGFANSYYDPYIYSSSRYGDVVDRESWKNLNVWLTGSVFNDYVTVEVDERFSFDSVLYNKEYDLGPALYSLLLHFVCSFFPGVFSWSFAFVINLVAFVFSSIFVYLIIFEISDNKFAGLFGILFYAFSGCATANYLYLRVYSLFTFWTLALFYVMVRFIKRKYKNNIVPFILLPLITILGCMTHYYFLVIAFFLTLFSALLIFLKKRYLDSVKFCIDMLLSVIAFFVLYRPALNMLLPYFKKESVVAGAAGHSMPYSWNISVANIHFFMGTIGFCINFTISLVLYALGIIVFAAVTICLFAFLFRNEEWFKNFVLSVKRFLQGLCSSVLKFFKSFDSSLFVAILASMAYMLIIPFSVGLYDMGYVERYLFPAMTIFLVGYSSVIGLVLFKLITKPSKKVLNTSLVFIICAMLVYLSFRSNVLTNDFKFSGMNEKKLTKELEGQDCYVLLHAVRDMVWLSPVLGQCNDVYMDLAAYIPLDDHAIPTLDSGCMLLVNTTDFLTDEQKESYEDSGEVELIGMRKPGVYMTVDDYISQIEEQTGFEYYLVEESHTFLGDLRLYRTL